MPNYKLQGEWPMFIMFLFAEMQDTSQSSYKMEK